jgi:RND family efflux transporter MFP subunit
MIQIRSCAFLLPAGLCAAMGMAGPADPPAPPAAAAPKAPKVAPVERGALAIVVERAGRVESAHVEPVRLELEAFGGQVTVKDVARRSGPAKAGEAIATLEGKDFDRGLEDMRTAVAEAHRRFDMQREERAMQARMTAAGVEKAQLSAELAAQALELHRDYEAAKAIEMADLALKGSMDGLRDSRDELSQLEKMYQGTSLQTETKDIVLERARRGVERGEVYSKYAKRDNEIFKAIRAPNDSRRVADQAKYSALELESAKLSQRLGEIKAELDMAQAERGLRDADRKLERMEGDAKRLRVKSPGDGYLVVRLQEPGDTVQPRQEVAQLVDLSRLRVKGSMNAEALRIVKPGDTVSVWFPARPEVRAEATVDEIVSVGTPEGDGAAFPFTATLRGTEGAVLPGIEARLVVRGSLADRVLVPSKAVHAEKGRFTVKVMDDGKETEREVRTGASDGAKTEVISGLQPGEQVVVPDA